MTAARPGGRPKMTADEVRALVKARHPGFTPPAVFVVGIRGYYRDGMGRRGENDRGMYDDALFAFTPSGFRAFNGNTDPTGYRKGHGIGATKGMASLTPGVWPVYRVGKHKGQYLALCQHGGPVTVMRDGAPPYPDTGNFGINIHKGGINTTSSEGCQTIPPDQWPEFINFVANAAKAQGVVPYVLLDGVG